MKHIQGEIHDSLSAHTKKNEKIGIHTVSPFMRK